MGQDEFAHLAGYVGPLGGPVPKAGPEPVRYGTDAEFSQQLGESAVAEHAVLKLRLHACRRHRPGGRGVVHLVPPRAADLAREAGGQHQELEGERRRPVRLRCAHPPERFGDLCERQIFGTA